MTGENMLRVIFAIHNNNSENFIHSEQGPGLKALLPFNIRNDNVTFGFFRKARPDQAEMSYYL